jgi:hypothetical protein
MPREPVAKLTRGKRDARPKRPGVGLLEEPRTRFL